MRQSKFCKNGKKAVVIVGAVSDAEGYEVQYSTSKSFSGKTVKTKSINSAATTLKSLKKNKNYYVRVRAYKTVNGSKVYGDWSASVKAKK